MLPVIGPSDQRFGPHGLTLGPVNEWKLPTDPAVERLLAALAMLRPADREALQLVLWDGLSHAEAASVLGCTANAFEIRYRRARAAVRDQLARRAATARELPVRNSAPVRGDAS